jgi:hypothetical protein
VGAATDACGNGGGPCRHWNAGNGTTGAPLVEALKQIQGLALGCTFPIPRPDAGTVDFAQVKVEYLPGKVETVLRQVKMGRHQAAILDPPRAGCEPAALAELLRLAPERLVYVSCEPSTHARDLIALVRGGYRVRRAAIVDMFPQTYHIETVALLERGSPG